MSYGGISLFHQDVMIGPDEARVYIINTKLLADAEVYERLYTRMPLYRRKKIDEYRFGKDRLLSLAAGVLLSAALKHAGENEDALTVCYTDNGRPFFLNRPDLHFSLSHAGSRAMCVLSGKPAGCDVEETAGNEDVDLKQFTAMESYLKATDGQLDELLAFDPDSVPDFDFMEPKTEPAYRYMLCIPSGMAVRLYEMTDGSVKSFMEDHPVLRWNLKCQIFQNINKFQ